MIQRSPKRTRCALPGSVTVMMLALAVYACGPANVNGDAMPQRDIKTVMDSHVDELMAIPNVVGVAIGALDDETPCIQVLVTEKSEELAKRIPETIEGHPVQIIESGVIRPMDGG